MITAEVTFSREQLVSLKHPMGLVGIGWETYEDISEEVGETSPLHITYNRGNLTIEPVTQLHEFLRALLGDLISLAGMAMQINAIATGSTTLRSEKRNFAAEPDLSFFVSKAGIHQTKDYVPDEIELAPDIVCEIDIYHASEDKFKIYAEFGVSEFWVYDGEKLKMFKLQKSGEYKEIERSAELPILTSAVLSDYLRRGQTEQQFVVLSDFQNWLQENK
jgi:Uma2 family endonuclease